MFDVVDDKGRTQHALGLDAIIDELTKDLLNATEGVMITFAPTKSETARSIELISIDVTDVLGWRLYQATETQMLGFASPATLQYFTVAPDTMYVYAEAL